MRRMEHRVDQELVDRQIGKYEIINNGAQMRFHPPIETLRDPYEINKFIYNAFEQEFSYGQNIEWFANRLFNSYSSKSKIKQFQINDYYSFKMRKKEVELATRRPRRGESRLRETSLEGIVPALKAALNRGTMNGTLDQSMDTSPNFDQPSTSQATNPTFRVPRLPRHVTGLPIRHARNTLTVNVVDQPSGSESTVPSRGTTPFDVDPSEVVEKVVKKMRHDEAELNLKGPRANSVQREIPMASYYRKNQARSPQQRTKDDDGFEISDDLHIYRVDHWNHYYQKLTTSFPFGCSDADQMKLVRCETGYLRKWLKEKKGVLVGIVEEFLERRMEMDKESRLDFFEGEPDEIVVAPQSPQNQGSSRSSRSNSIQGPSESQNGTSNGSKARESRQGSRSASAAQSPVASARVSRAGSPKASNYFDGAENAPILNGANDRDVSSAASINGNGNVQEPEDPAEPTEVMRRADSEGSRASRRSVSKTVPWIPNGDAQNGREANRAASIVSNGNVPPPEQNERRSESRRRAETVQNGAARNERDSRAPSVLSNLQEPEPQLEHEDHIEPTDVIERRVSEGSSRRSLMHWIPNLANQNGRAESRAASILSNGNVPPPSQQVVRRSESRASRRIENGTGQNGNNHASNGNGTPSIRRPTVQSPQIQNGRTNGDHLNRIEEEEDDDLQILETPPHRSSSIRSQQPNGSLRNRNSRRRAVASSIRSSRTLCAPEDQESLDAMMMFIEDTSGRTNFGSKRKRTTFLNDSNGHVEDEGAPKPKKARSSQNRIALEARRNQDERLENLVKKLKREQMDCYRRIANSFEEEGFEFWQNFCDSKMEQVLNGREFDLMTEIRNMFPDEFPDRNYSRIYKIMEARDELDVELTEHAMETSGDFGGRLENQFRLEHALRRHLNDLGGFEEETIDLNVPTFVIRQFFHNTENRARARRIIVPN